MKALLVSVALVVAVSLSGCSGNSAALAKAKAEAEAARGDLAKVKAEADAAKAELAQLKALLPSPPITKVGEHKLYEGKMVVTVFEEDGFLGYDLKITLGGMAKAESRTQKELQLKKDDAVWAIYPESSDTIWVYWADRKGKGTLARHNFKHVEKGEKGVPTTSSDVAFFGPEPESAIESMPRAMRDALPKEFVEAHKRKK